MFRDFRTRYRRGYLGAARRLLLFSKTYTDRVSAIAPGNLIGWWKMAEGAGATVSLDSSGQGNNGAYTAVTLGQPGIGDGLTAASFNGTSSFNNIYSAALNSDFNGAEGTLAAWIKVSAAGVWSDATVRYVVNFEDTTGNRLIAIYRTATNNTLRFHRRGQAGAVNKTVDLSTSTTGWLHVALTWSEAADQVIAYANGVQIGSTQTSIGAWGGSLSSTRTIIGALVTTPTFLWSGFLAHPMLWTTPLSAAQILQLATVP